MNNNKFKKLSPIQIEENVFEQSGNNPNSIDWYNEAKENVISAEILFREGHFPRCIYLLQQCTEVLVKGLFIQTQVSNLPKAFSHSPQYALTLMYDELDKAIGTKEPSQFALNHLNLIKSLQNRKISSFDGKLPLLCNAIASTLNQLHDTIPTSIKEQQQIEKSYVQNLLSIFSILFEGTEQNTRYPMNDSTPSEIYVTDNIRNCIPIVITHLKNIADMLLASTGR